MAAKTEHISYRISQDVLAELEQQAKAVGLSPNAFACEALLEKLQRTQSERRGWLELFEEVHRFRSDFALATEALLTVAGRGENAREKAAAWVRQNLNR